MVDENQGDIVQDAGEYMLGTLDDVSRARFEHLLASDVSANQALEFWQDRLNYLSLHLQPVEPPAQVWRGIEAAINRPAQSAAEPATAESQSHGRSRLPFWRSAAVAASIVAVVLAAFLFVGPGLQQTNEPVPAYAAMIQDDQTGMSWLVTVQPDSRRMVVRAIGDYSVPEDKVLHAWVKPKQGSAEFVGALPHARGEYSMQVSKSVAGSLGDDAQLMISMDSADAEKQDGPGGPIMWQTTIARRTG